MDRTGDIAQIPQAATIVGREPELAHILRHRGVTVVEGDAGIGKTALLAEVRRHRAAVGHLTLAGAAATSPAAPLTLLMEAFGAGAVLDVLADAPYGPDATPWERQQSYRRLRESLAASASASGGLLLVLDDVQHADAESVDIVSALVRGPLPAGLDLLIGARSGRMPAPLERALAIAADVLRLQLGPLPDLAVASFLPVGPEERRSRVSRLGRGNPRYLGILAALDSAAVDAMDRGAGAEPVELTGPCGAAIRTEMLAIASPAADVAAAAAVVGDDPDADMVAAVAQLDESVVALGLDALVAEDVLRCSPGGQLTFRHPLVRAAAYRAASPAWRRGAHRRAAGWLAAHGGTVGAQAWHVAAYAGIGDAAAHDLLVEAAAGRLATAPADAVGWLDVALRIRPRDHADDPNETVVLLARACRLAGDPRRARQLLRELPDRPTVDVAALLARCEQDLGDPAAARAVLTDALRGCADPTTRAEVRLELARLDLLDCRQADVQPAAAAEACTAGTAAAGAIVAALRGLSTGTLESRAAGVDRAAAAVDALDDVALRPVVGYLHLLGWAEFHLDRFADAGRHADRAVAASGRHGLLDSAPCLPVFRAVLAQWRGDVTSALRAADEAADLARRLELPDDRILAAAVALLPRIWQDGPAGASADLVVAADYTAVASPWKRAIAATLYAEAMLAVGEPTAAVGAARAALRASGDIGDPQRPRILALAAMAELAAGDRRTAQRRLEEAEASLTDVPDSQRAEVDMARARLAAAGREFSSASDAATRAARRFTAAGMPVAAGRATLLHVELAGAAGAPHLARPGLEGALDALVERGATWLADGVDAALRRLDGPAAASGPGGGDVLSRRELEIARLVCEGLTNKAIAGRLFLSVRTVDTHVARILTKLGVSSRLGVVRALEPLPRTA